MFKKFNAFNERFKSSIGSNVQVFNAFNERFKSLRVQMFNAFNERFKSSIGSNVQVFNAFNERFKSLRVQKFKRTFKSFVSKSFVLIVQEVQTALPIAKVLVIIRRKVFRLILLLLQLPIYIGHDFTLLHIVKFSFSCHGWNNFLPFFF